MKKKIYEESKKNYGINGILLGLVVVFVTIIPPMVLLWWAVVPTESVEISDKVTTLIGAGLLTFVIVRIKQHIGSVLRRIEGKWENKVY